MLRIFFISVILISFFTSCRSTKKIQTAISKKDTVAIVPVISTDNGHNDSMQFIRTSYNRLQNQRINFTTFNAKVEVDYQDAEGKKYNVNAHVRMYKDSVMWVSITAILGIEGLRAYITKDSVRMLDKQNKVYSIRSLASLQEITNLPLDLSSLQDLIIGNTVFLDSNIISYSKTENTISLLSIGDFFRNLLTIQEQGYLVKSSKLDDVDELRNRTCYLTYDDYENGKGVLFSTKRTISVTEKKKLDIQLNFKQYDFNETLSFPFSVPKNYKHN